MRRCVQSHANHMLDRSRLEAIDALRWRLDIVPFDTSFPPLQYHAVRYDSRISEFPNHYRGCSAHAANVFMQKCYDKCIMYPVQITQRHAMRD